MYVSVKIKVKTKVQTAMLHWLEIEIVSLITMNRFVIRKGKLFNRFNFDDSLLNNTTLLNASTDDDFSKFNKLWNPARFGHRMAGMSDVGFW